jgi:hypothetical protein
MKISMVLTIEFSEITVEEIEFLEIRRTIFFKLEEILFLELRTNRIL